MKKRPRLTLLSIYISESQKIGRQASVEIMVVRKSVCRMPFVCLFWFIIAENVFAFSHSLNLFSVLTEQWWEEILQGPTFPFFLGQQQPYLINKDVRRSIDHIFLSLSLAITDREVRNIMVLPFVTIAKNRTVQKPFSLITL